jgi:hypothetical protein
METLLTITNSMVNRVFKSSAMVASLGTIDIIDFVMIMMV